jgi:FKBP-type peptidyl-prolyl cis-trans isomerase
VSSVPKLVVTDLKVGNGAEAKADSTLTVTYQGALAKDGTIFDATSDGQPATFALSQVIEGWQKGIPGMKVGGTRQLLIPAAQAYGAQSPSASIPANSDLVFIVTLQAVK